MRRKLLPLPAAGAAVVLLTTGVALAATAGSNKPLSNNLVGRQSDGSVLTPDNQFVTPIGDVIEQPGRPITTTLSPDGKKAVDLTWDGKGVITIVDLVGKKVLQTYQTPKNVGSGDVSYGGLAYSPDGKFLWAGQSSDLLRFPVDLVTGMVGTPTVVPLPGMKTTIPTGDATGIDAPLPSDVVFTPDGKSMLVTLNGDNTLAVLDPTTGAVKTQIPTGNAPRDVVVLGGKAYVANQGGRPAGPTDFVNPSYGTNIVSDTTDGSASTGTVSEIDLATNKAVTTFAVGLQPTALLAHGTDLLVANSNDDSISVIDTAAQSVGQTFNVNPVPGGAYGASPNAMAFVDANHLAVSLGRDNAIAEYSYTDAHNPVGFDGLLPTGWYPGSVLMDKQLGKLIVGNEKGVGSLGPVKTQNKGPGTAPATGHSVYSDVGTIQIITPPTTQRQVQADTAQVFTDNQWNGIQARNARGNKKAKPVAVPLHLGDPSTIKHVFVIVKENRTYDQVLGDDPRGNGSAALAQFGGPITPNFHALAKQFPLIDNLYSDGTLSADGHNWLTQAFVNDYIEKSFGNFTRSYPAQGGDSLAYAKSGFIWDNAARHGVSTKVWGEYANYFNGPGNTAPQGTWQQWYHDSQVLEGKAQGPLHAPIGYYQSHSDVPSLEHILVPSFPNFQLQIPDQYRTDLFNRDFAQLEKKRALPALNLLWVMDDHTAGVQPNFPTPRAEVADNDLATGRIIDTISHSKDWAHTAVFVIEDDSQNGVDHVDGHRNPTFIASPYAKHGAVVHDYYSELNVDKTIEAILGLPPMNQLDLAAVAMTGAFTNKPDLTPFKARPNQIPLDEYPPPAAAMSRVERAWVSWAQQQNFGTEDSVPMGQLNRDVWYSTNGFTKAYPGDSRVLAPNEVPTKTSPADGHPAGTTHSTNQHSTSTVGDAG